MMRLLIVTADFPPNIGGIAVDTMRLFRLLKTRHEAELCAFGIDGTSGEGVEYLKTRKIFFMRHLGRKLSSKKYDAILVRTVLPLGWMLNMMKTEAKKIYFAYGQELLHDMNSPLLLRKSVQEILSGADAVVVNSRFTNSLIGGKGRVFYPLVEMPESACSERRGDSFKILLAGRLVKHKNFISVLRIIREIDERTAGLTGRRVKLEIIGDGPMEDYLKAYIRENDLSFIVNMKGRIESEKMNASYSGADLVIMPSIRTRESVEGFGMVAQEAVLCGSLCIGYDSGGIGESIGDKDLLVRENDEAGMTDLAVKLLTERDFYEAKRITALKRTEIFIAGERRLDEFEEISGIKK